MDSMEINKVASAVLVAGIAFMVSGVVSETLVHPARLKQAAIKIESAAPATSAPAAGAPAEPPPIAALLASADPAAGEADTKKLCSICHSFNEGGKAIVGPNLYGIVGAPHAHMVGYDYSSAIKGKQGPWTYDELNKWLTKPAAYAPGTKMGFAGITNDKERADVIDYLHTLSHTPEPLPPVTQAAATASAPGAAAAAPGPASQDVDVLLASANPDTGKADTMKYGCIACHSFNSGGKAGLGPNLYGVVGGPHAHMVGYEYSAALKAHQGPWTYDELNKWLTKPAAYAPGTKMSFAGINNPKDRADVIDYLRTLSDHPEPLPAAAQAPAPAVSVAPAAGAAGSTPAAAAGPADEHPSTDTAPSPAGITPPGTKAPTDAPPAQSDSAPIKKD